MNGARQYRSWPLFWTKKPIMLKPWRSRQRSLRSMKNLNWPWGVIQHWPVSLRQTKMFGSIGENYSRRWGIPKKPMLPTKRSLKLIRTIGLHWKYWALNQWRSTKQPSLTWESSKRMGQSPFKQKYQRMISKISQRSYLTRFQQLGKPLTIRSTPYPGRTRMKQKW